MSLTAIRRLTYLAPLLSLLIAIALVGHQYARRNYIAREMTHNTILLKLLARQLALSSSPSQPAPRRTDTPLPH